MSDYYCERCGKYHTPVNDWPTCPDCCGYGTVPPFGSSDQKICGRCGGLGYAYAHTQKEPTL